MTLTCFFCMELVQLLLFSQPILLLFNIFLCSHLDRGPSFVSQVWKRICKALVTLVSLSSSFHTHVKGQSEGAKQAFETTLCYVPLTSLPRSPTSSGLSMYTIPLYCWLHFRCLWSTSPHCSHIEELAIASVQIHQSLKGNLEPHQGGPAS